MTGTFLLIILAASIGMFHDTNKPKEYELSMEDGSNIHIVLQKNSQYACPLYCEVDHIHHAVVCNDEKQIEYNKFVYHISEKNENGFSFYCSTKKIISMSKFAGKTAKDQIPDVASASIDE